MTDPGMADATYIEPLNLPVLTEIIAAERPDAILPNLGGQTGLNLSSELHRAGVLDRFGVKVIGVNVDAMGVHTGDSYCTAPMLTIDPALQKRLQDYSYRIVEAIEVIGGTNIQFAHHPQTGRVVVIEINPRTSRSSALASKAAGFPIARVSALLAGGLAMDEIPYWRDGSLEKYTPSGEYVVVKFARWAFEKFKGIEDRLGTQMRAVGEVMSIGKNYKEALQKAIRSLETGRYGLGFARNFHELPLETLLRRLAEPTSERQFILYEALRKGADVQKLHELTHNFSTSRSTLDLAGRKAIHDLEGGEPADLSAYARAGSEPSLAMIETIRRRLGLTTLKYQRLDDLVAAIGLPEKKVCTHCWDGSSCCGPRGDKPGREHRHGLPRRRQPLTGAGAALHRRPLDIFHGDFAD